MNNSSDLEAFENRESEGIKGCPLQRSVASCVVILHFVKGFPALLTCVCLDKETLSYKLEPRIDRQISSCHQNTEPPVRRKDTLEAPDCCVSHVDEVCGRVRTGRMW